MKEELKSGIKEYDELIEMFENGEITFLALTDGLWNKGYKAGIDEVKIYEELLYYALNSDGEFITKMLADRIRKALATIKGDQQ